jgi:hypothetical protein
MWNILANEKDRAMLASQGGSVKARATLIFLQC